MATVFEEYMRTQAGVNQEELDRIVSAGIRKNLRKKEFLTREGAVFPYKSFVLKGCLKSYRIREEGSEHIIRFVTENGWLADSESFHLGKPSPYNIDAIEETDLLLWTKPVFEELIAAIPRYRQFSDRIMANSVTATQNRIFANLSFTPEEKYHSFLAEFPGLAARIPLHMIASYLGISRETLTRVRTNQSKIRTRSSNSH